MRDKFTASWLTSILLFFTINVSLAAEAPPLEVYGRLPDLENVAISPDGSRIAYVRTQGDERVLYVLTLADRKPLHGLRLGAAKLRDIQWGDNDHLLVITSTSNMPLGLSGAKSEFALMQVFDVVSGKTVDALRTNAHDITLNAIAGLPMVRKVNGDATVFVVGFAAQNNHFLPVLFRFSLSHGLSGIVARGTDVSSRWLVDKDGTIIATENYNDRERLWKVGVRINDRMTTVASGEAQIEYPTLSGFAPDGSALWLQSLDNNEPIWKSIALKDGALSGVLAETKGFEGLLTEPYTGRIVGGRLTNADHDLEFFDNNLRATWQVVKHAFPNESVNLVSVSEGFKKLVLLVDGPQHGLLYVLFDTDTFESEQLGRAYDGLTQYAAVRPLHYQASDGMNIPAFVTLPPNRAAKNLPLIVLPHGGPAARDTGEFDWLAQALATRGYVVLQPNYRGSNLNWQFMSAGFGEWGRKMQTDLSDGVRALVKQGLVDPTRVCIVGASYGGYAALAGASLDTGVYRCAIAIAGISDLGRFQNWITAKRRDDDSIESRYFDRYIGASGVNDPLIAARSPRQQVANITIPILLIHGRDDSIVPYEQSEWMADALQRAHKPVEFVTLSKEDHWLSRSETRLQMLQATVRFLKENNPAE